MQEKCKLCDLEASYGRTLWNNLVIGLHTDVLDDRPGFGRATSIVEDVDKSTCSFSYKGAEIIVTCPNNVTIKADSENVLREAESRLNKICSEKGISLAIAA